jgi:hypothetical protein
MEWSVHAVVECRVLVQVRSVVSCRAWCFSNGYCSRSERFHCGGKRVVRWMGIHTKVDGMGGPCKGWSFVF